MTTIQTLLRDAIDENGYTVYSFAQRSGINRTTLQKILSGDRTLSADILEQILTYLNLTPVQTKNMKTAFLIYNIGPNRYRNRMYIKNFLEWHADTFFRSNLDTNPEDMVPFPRSNACIPPNSTLIKGQNAIIQLIYLILLQNTEETFHLYSYTPFRLEFYTQLLHMLQHVPEADIRLHHLVMVDTANHNPDGVYYNLQVITSLLPYLLHCNNSAFIRYFYGNISKFRLDSVVFPNYIILNHDLILISQDFETGLYLSAPDIHEHYFSIYEHMYNQARPLSQNSAPAIQTINYMMEHIPHTGNGYILKHQPSLAPIVSREILEQTVAQAHMDHPQDMWAKLFQYQQQLQKEESCFLFNKAGIDEIAFDGVCTELSYHPHQINIDHRITLLKNMIRCNRRGSIHYQMLNEHNLRLNPGFSLSVREPNNLYMVVHSQNHISRLCEFHENTVYQAFMDFLVNTDQLDLTYSIEQTNTYILSLIHKLEQLRGNC